MGIQVFQVCYLSSRSLVSEYIGIFLRVTWMQSQPINSVKVHFSLGIRRANTAETLEAGSEEEQVLQQNWRENVREGFADFHTVLAQNSMKNNLL